MAGSPFGGGTTIISGSQTSNSAGLLAQRAEERLLISAQAFGERLPILGYAPNHQHLPRPPGLWTAGSVVVRP